MGRLTRLAAAATAALALAGCGEERATTTDTTATRVPGPTDTLVVYRRTGGEEGARERLDVRPDGAARVTDRGRAATVRLTGPELDGLRAAREGADLARLRDFYGPEPPPLDAYDTRLTVGGRTVRIVHDARVPPELERLRAACAGLVERYRPR